MFLIDSSKSVTPSDFQLEKEFVKVLSYHFNISQTGTRGGVVTYATNSYTIAGFADPEFSKKVNSASLIGTPRRTDKALEYAAQMFKRSGRKGQKIVVLLTVGKHKASVGSKSLNEAIQPLRNIGALTFVVSIGSDADPRDLAPVVDTSEDIFEVSYIGNLPVRGKPIAKQIRDRSSKSCFVFSN